MKRFFINLFRQRVEFLEPVPGNPNAKDLKVGWLISYVTMIQKSKGGYESILCSMIEHRDPGDKVVRHKMIPSIDTKVL